MDKRFHDGHRERMRNRIKTSGIDGLQPHEVLEYILYSFVPRKDTNVIAHRLIDKFGSFSAVIDANVEDLASVEGVSIVSATFLHSLKGISNFYQTDKTSIKDKINTVEKVGKYMCNRIGFENKEQAYLLLFNNQSELIKIELISKGTVDKVGIYTREIAEIALRNKATNVIICHNHPSGGINPSIDDINLTRAVYTSLRMINIRLLDHMIVAGDKYYSMKFNGDFNEIIENVENRLGEGFF